MEPEEVLRASRAKEAAARRKAQRAEIEDLNMLPGWKVTATFEPQDGTPVIVGLTVEPADELDVPNGGLGSRDLRQIKTAELALLAHRGLQVLSTFAPQGWLDRQGFSDLSQPAKRPGRRGRPIEDYLRVAIIYAEACRKGDPHPVAAIARELGCEREQAAQLKYTAQNTHGLLTKNPRAGVAGGALTPKALELIRERDQEER